MTNVVLTLTTHVLVQHLVAVTYTTLCVIQLTVFVLHLCGPFVPLLEVKTGHSWCLLLALLVVHSYNNSTLRFNFFSAFIGIYDVEVEDVVEVEVYSS